ncbi:hypothetical protein [Streptomyces sp. bgisy091]|uniref:hypothetical protein n=1 Tax=Streptomyces sp. bgisy091 TaxID=3413778 RepID=UPI003D74769F
MTTEHRQPLRAHAARRLPAADRATRTRAAVALLSEVLLTGVLTTIGSLLVVTAVPSLATGVAHIRRQAAGLDTGVGRFAREWWAAVRDLWLLGLAGFAVVGLLAFDLLIVASGALPGSRLVALMVGVSAALAAVVLLRTAGAWSDRTGRPASATVRELLTEATSATRDDLTGSVLLIVAVVLCSTFVWMLPPLLLLVGGLLALAVVGVEARRLELTA